MPCHIVLADRATPNPGAASSARSTAPTYARHDPQRTLLYALVQAHYPDFFAQMVAQDRPLPAYVREAFEAYLRCGVLEHGFLRVVCEHCHAERLVEFSCKQRGFCPSCGARRMAESARHLVEDVFGPRPVRQWVLSVPFPLRWLFASKPQAIGPVLAIVQRVIGNWLADQAGVGRASAVCQEGSAAGDDAMNTLRMRSITCRIATGKHAGRKVATLQTLPADADAVHGDAGQVGGFSLRAGVAAQAHEADKLERLCRYIKRPAIAERRLSISPQGRVRYELKTPWKNGTTHVEFEPIEFIAKLAALVPPPSAAAR